MYQECDSDILDAVQAERNIYEPDVPIYPDPRDLFRAFELCPFDMVRVVIIGQDPYHGGQANGLAFSVKNGCPIPPSLRNIFKELADDLQTPLRTDPDLSDWAANGVLLLNSFLTVRSGNAGSHSRIGWETYTDSIISQVSRDRPKVVFMLWGGFAKKKRKLIDKEKHLVLEANHPSPLSANRGGWFGCKHFSKASQYLGQNIFM